MRSETITTDITVVGGGLAGVCAAVAAARSGRTVALVQNRPVLGGNSSSEVRVWVSGASATGTQRFARETGIMGELLVENQFMNPDGNPYYWDLVVHEAVLAEPNIQLFLNTDVHEVEAEGDEHNRRIHSVTGWMMGSERRLRFESEMFLDCSGDGLVGFLAGAEYRIGREARSLYGEEWAPEEADNITLGSTILFYTKDVGKPVKYIPPSFAKDITTTTIPTRRIIRTGDSGCYYWWIEWGGEVDTVHDNERIRDELWAAIYGIWDYIKNSGQFEADNLTLEWVGSVPGKREYRRFIGDYVLKQQDIVNQVEFPDKIAFGGWSIDLHPPQGMYAEASGSKHLFPDGTYHIPFRSLYSSNVSNMLMAGRNISASHVAFGTTRVMATCAVMGEAAGAAAAMCVERGITPRTLAEEHMEELQQALLRNDGSIIGLRNADPKDLARQAAVQASSWLDSPKVEHGDKRHPLDTDAGLLMPVNPELQTLELLVDASENTELTVEVWDTGRAENYVPYSRQATDTVSVEQGEKQWVKLNLPWKPSQPQNAFIIIRANASLHVWLADESITGVMGFVRSKKRPVVDPTLEVQPEQPVVEWDPKKLVRQTFCFRLSGKSEAYHPSMVLNGYSRPYGGPNLWASHSMTEQQEEWIELSWQDEVACSEIHLTFNDEVNEYLINLHYITTPFDIIPELAADYRIEGLIDGQWQLLHRETGNRKRKRVHRLESVKTDRIRLVIERTNGSATAQLIEMRVYE
ncbi:FAD-dependent oxidoreductase [Paenibacillus sp. PL2-23]|uniref:FAD-dependent oxidoreductase n=1 Tax=Paenibacillus sp. PL2-23 TaxID=2100729 RepID=UPI0030FAFDFF